MQLKLHRFSIILLLIIGVLGVTSKKANVVEAHEEAGQLFPEEKSEIHHHALSTHDQSKRSLSKGSRPGRTTFVKAILSSPDELSPTQVLAKKFAEESLKSPRMQATFKRLSEVRSPSETDDGGSRKIVKTVGVIRSVKSIGNSHKSKNHDKKKKRKRKKKQKSMRKHSLKNRKRSHHHHHHPHLLKHHHSKPAHLNMIRRHSMTAKGNYASGKAAIVRMKVMDVQDNNKSQSIDDSLKYSRRLKLDVKRNDLDCIIDRTRLFNFIGNPQLLPMADLIPIDVDEIYRVRRVRQAFTNLSNTSFENRNANSPYKHFIFFYNDFNRQQRCCNDFNRCPGVRKNYLVSSELKKKSSNE